MEVRARAFDMVSSREADFRGVVWTTVEDVGGATDRGGAKEVEGRAVELTEVAG